jgi:phospholipid:diacylglycerol acyltransferase
VNTSLLRMASLRHRVFGSPRGKEPLEVEELRLAPLSKILKNGHQKAHKRRNGFVFFLGGLFGLVVAGFFAQRNDLLDLPEFRELSMDSLMDVLPAGFVRDARDLAVCPYL